MPTEYRCKDCKHDKGKCVGSTRRGWHKNCFEPKVMTKADRIRAMTDEELADWLARTQISNIKEAMDALQIPFEVTDETKEASKSEILEVLLQPTEQE